MLILAVAVEDWVGGKMRDKGLSLGLWLFGILMACVGQAFAAERSGPEIVAPQFRHADGNDYLYVTVRNHGTRSVCIAERDVPGPNGAGPNAFFAVVDEAGNTARYKGVEAILAEPKQHTSYCRNSRSEVSLPIERFVLPGSREALPCPSNDTGSALRTARPWLRVPEFPPQREYACTGCGSAPRRGV